MRKGIILIVFLVTCLISCVNVEISGFEQDIKQQLQAEEVKWEISGFKNKRIGRGTRCPMQMPEQHVR